MKWIPVAITAVLSLRVASAQLETNAIQLADLRLQLTRFVESPRFKAAEWGIKVVETKGGGTLWETNALKLLKPASNAKLYTGALALHRFGPDYRIRTSILAAQAPDTQGVLHGDLVIYGRGDFSLAARFREGSYSNLLGPLVNAIQKAGIKRVAGDLVGDESFFRGPRFGSGWTWDDLQYYYGAEVSALTFQDNVVDFRITPGAASGDPCRISLQPSTTYLQLVNRSMTAPAGTPPKIELYRPLGENRVYVSGHLPVGHAGIDDASTVSDPARWFVEMLREALERQGIAVGGKTRTHAWPEQASYLTNAVELGWIESPPNRELIARMMKPSQNLYAQLLLLQAGSSSTNSTAQTTEGRGLHELRMFLRAAGISAGEVLLDEGSGLSRSALVTPNATVKLLQFMSRHEHAEAFRATLPEAGVDGTLRNRLRPLKGKVRAKTGTIRYVNTLSGYAQSADGVGLTFSIMLNAYNNTSETTSREDIDRIVSLLTRTRVHADSPSGSVSSSEVKK